MGMRMKRVRLGGAKVVTDFFITFYLRVPQATVEVVLIRVMNGVAWFLEVDCVEGGTKSPKFRTLHFA